MRHLLLQINCYLLKRILQVTFNTRKNIHEKQKQKTSNKEGLKVDSIQAYNKKQSESKIKP